MMIKSEYFSSSSSFSIKSFNPIGSSSGQLHHPPLTIFDLVESHSVPLLYSMLAMSLHNVPIVEVACFRPSDHYYNCYSDDYNISPVVHKKTTKRSSIKNDSSSSSSSSSHLSITLPCKAFYNSSTLYNITIILMDSGYADGASQRCFLGILTPIIITTPTHEPTGVIEHKEEDDAVAMMVTQEQQQHCQDGPCPYYPKFAFGKVLCIDDKFLCQLLLGSK